MDTPEEVIVDADVRANDTSPLHQRAVALVRHYVPRWPLLVVDTWPRPPRGSNWVAPVKEDKPEEETEIPRKS